MSLANGVPGILMGALIIAVCAFIVSFSDLAQLAELHTMYSIGSIICSNGNGGADLKVLVPKWHTCEPGCAWL